MSVYKKFTAQDFALVPFNAHKQYNFVSSSASENKVTHFSSRWTSESISLYSSASTNPDGLFDPINTIKYNQIDHLFYKDFKTSHANRFDNFDYLEQRRDLYERANILSIPSGLYGHEIKPTSLYISSANNNIVDDGKGNLILSGTNVNDYPLDVRSNIFRLDPVKGFKSYDLTIFSDYAIKLRDPQGQPYEVIKQFYRQGTVDPNALKTQTVNYSNLVNITSPIATMYTTPTSSLDVDDSYFFNKLSLNNIIFSTSSLGSLEITQSRFSSLNFMAPTGSFIVSPDDIKYDFNREDDFSISFYMRPKSVNINPPGIGDYYGGGIVFAVSESADLDSTGQPITYAYIVYPDIQNIKASINEPLSLDNFPAFSLSPSLPSINLSGSATSSGFNHYEFNDSLNFNDPSNVFARHTLDFEALETLGTDSSNLFSNTIGKVTDRLADPNDFNESSLFSSFSQPNPQEESIIGGQSFFGKPKWRHFLMHTAEVSTFASGSFQLGSGEKNTEEWIHPTLGFDHLPVIKAVKEATVGGYEDWWLPSYDEMNQIYRAFDTLNPIGYPQHYTVPGFDNSPFTDSQNIMGTTFNANIVGTYPRYAHYVGNIPDNIIDGLQGIPIISPWFGEATGDYGEGGFLENNAHLGIMVGGGTFQSPENQFTGLASESPNQTLTTGQGRNTLLDDPDKDLIFYTSNARHHDVLGTIKEVLVVPSKAPRIPNNQVVGQREKYNSFQITTNLADGPQSIYTLVSSQRSLNNVESLFGATSQVVGGTKTLTPQSNLPYYPMPIEFLNKAPQIIGIEIDNFSQNQQIAQSPGITYDYDVGDIINNEDHPPIFTINEDGTNATVIEGAVLGGEGYYSPSSNLSESVESSVYGGDEGQFIINSSIPINQAVIENVSIDQVNQQNTEGTGLHLDLVVTHDVINTFLDFQNPGPGYLVQATINESSIPFCQGYQIGDRISIPGSTFTQDDTPFSSHQVTCRISNVIYDTPTHNSPAAFLMVRKEPLIVEMDDKKRYIISKSTTKTIIPPTITTRAGKGSAVLNTNSPGNLQTLEINSETQFPFEIYMSGSEIFFDRSDGEQTVSVSSFATSSIGQTHNTTFHVLCQNSSSTMEMYIDGHLATSSIDLTKKPTQNRANLYIGAKGNQSETEATNIKIDKFYHGELSNINIYDRSFNATSSNGSLPIQLISESINASPYIGNMFYQNGFAVITHPKYQEILGSYTVGDMIIGESFTVDADGEFGIDVLQFQGSHLVYEHEYQCTVDEQEFNDTLNITARDIPSTSNYEVANFTTGSLFKPYVTTIGLYNDNGELLVVGKLGQPIRTSNETDTTFIMRWDS